MKSLHDEQNPAPATPPAAPDPVPGSATTGGPEAAPREIGGRDGPDPTRYGDWEKAGRCIDF